MIATVMVLLGGIALVIAALVFSVKRKKKEQKQALAQAVGEQATLLQLSWTNIDIDHHRATAWSHPRRVLFYVDLSDKQPISQVINTALMKDCRIVNQYSESASIKSVLIESNITKVDLQFTFITQPPVSICLYDEHKDGIYEKIRLSEKARNLKTLITTA